MNRAIQEQQRLYESFILQVGGNVGELQLDPGEAIRSTKVRLRRAATRLSVPVQIWDADGKVYFKGDEQTRRRGRPRKTA